MLSLGQGFGGFRTDPRKHWVQSRNIPWMGYRSDEWQPAHTWHVRKKRELCGNPQRHGKDVHPTSSLTKCTGSSQAWKQTEDHAL